MQTERVKKAMRKENEGGETLTRTCCMRAIGKNCYLLLICPWRNIQGRLLRTKYIRKTIANSCRKKRSTIKPVIKRTLIFMSM